MERDFLGLSSNSKEPLPLVKDEARGDGFKEIGFSKGSEIQWSCMNRVSAVPQMMAFNVAQGDKTKGIGSEPLLSYGFRPFSSMVAYDPSLQRSRTEIQMFPALEQPISVYAQSKPIFKNHFTPYSQNLVANPANPQLFGGTPVATPHFMPPTVGSVGGSTESRKGVTVSGSPAQLTIFYAGAVCVFEDISPEKAQAIMCLAGHGASAATAVAQPKLQVKPPSPKPVPSDIGPIDLSMSTPSDSGHASPLSVSSPTCGQSRSGSTSTDDMAVQTAGIASSDISKVGASKMVQAMESAAQTSMIPSVPQARKASLARFLQKRKERVTVAAPYDQSQKPTKAVGPDTNGLDFFASSAVGIGSLSKQGNHDL